MRRRIGETVGEEGKARRSLPPLLLRVTFFKNGQILSHCLSFGFIKVKQNLFYCVMTELKDLLIFQTINSPCPPPPCILRTCSPLSSPPARRCRGPSPAKAVGRASPARPARPPTVRSPRHSSCWPVRRSPTRSRWSCRAKPVSRRWGRT